MRPGTSASSRRRRRCYRWFVGGVLITCYNVVELHLDTGRADQAIRIILEKRFKATKVKPFTPHDLRRTFAGEMLDAGVDLVTVRHLMGHASPVTTSRYDRRDEKTKMEAATKIHFPIMGN